MPRLRHVVVILAIVSSAFSFGAGTAMAAGTIVFDGSPGTGPPTTTLGPYTMTPLPLDPQPLFQTVGGVAGPSGSLAFSPSLEHLRVTQGWATWSHGYLGDVYWTRGALTATVTLPPNTSAFYLYAEPNPFAVFTITATAQDGTTSGPIAVNGLAGARYFGFYGTGGERIASVTVTSNVDFAIGEFGISGRPKNYVALGDSYSSGEGVPPFFAGTDGPSDYCHRSPLAYSQVLGTLYGMTPKFYACSGAITSNITSTFHNTEAPQITRPGVDNTADLVTITIGGNDAGFSDVLKACIGQKLKADVINAAIGRVGRWLGLGKEPSCAKSSSFTSSAHQRIDNVYFPVRNTYASLKSATDPETSIIAANYPRLFPVDDDDQNCLALDFILTNDTQDWMNSAGDRLDDVLASAASAVGVNFVDVRGAFTGHEVCGPAGSYINGLSMASGSGGACTWSVLGKCIIPGIPLVGSFHPNAAGHADGYAAAISAYIDSAADKNGAGFPRNLFSGQARVQTTPAVGIGPLTADPLTPGSDDCTGTYQAGQQVAVSGGGFQPGTSVEIYASSAGYGSVAELLVGQATADADGHFAAVVRVPLSATGFTPEGSAAGLVILDAIGLGSEADHWDDVAIIGLAPHDSSCGTVEELPFAGFDPPVANAPALNAAQPGRALPVKFTIPGSNGTLDAVLAAGYPQSTPVSCTSPGEPTSGAPTERGPESTPPPADDYNYVWKTDRAWRGCRVLIVKLVDDSYHRAVFDFGS
jgi:lysophospholipase L1-like esterase